MPVIKSAKKKLRQDKKKQARNEAVRNLVKKLIKQSKSSPTEKAVKKATATIAKAAKRHIFHKNKAARLQSALSKLHTKQARKQ